MQTGLDSILCRHGEYLCLRRCCVATWVESVTDGTLSDSVVGLVDDVARRLFSIGLISLIRV